MTYVRPVHGDLGNDGSATDLTNVIDALSDGLEAAEASLLTKALTSDLAGRAAALHATQHLPGNSDGLTTGAPAASSIGVASGVGVAQSFSRSDHVHAREAGAAPTAAAGLGKTNVAGAAVTVARSDHDHATNTAAAIQAALTTATTVSKGLVGILPNDATKYWDGTGAYSVPVGTGGGGGTGVRSETHTLEWQGTVVTNVGASRVYMTRPGTIESVVLGLSTPPTGASVVCDVNRNGTTIFGTQANRPNVVAASNSSGAVLAGSMSVTTFAAGDFFTFDIDQVGATVAGADLTCTIRLLV